MRIAYCIHSLHNSGGMERVLTIKANALSALSGCEVHIIAYGLKGRKPYFPLEPAVVVHDLGINERIRPVTFKRKLSKVLKAIRPDVTIGPIDNAHCIYCFRLPNVAIKSTSSDFWT